MVGGLKSKSGRLQDRRAAARASACVSWQALWDFSSRPFERSDELPRRLPAHPHVLVMGASRRAGERGGGGCHYRWPIRERGGTSGATGRGEGRAFGRHGSRGGERRASTLTPPWRPEGTEGTLGQHPAAHESPSTKRRRRTVLSTALSPAGGARMNASSSSSSASPVAGVRLPRGSPPAAPPRPPRPPAPPRVEPRGAPRPRVEGADEEFW